MGCAGQTLDATGDPASEGNLGLSTSAFDFECVNRNLQDGPLHIAVRETPVTTDQVGPTTYQHNGLGTFVTKIGTFVLRGLKSNFDGHDWTDWRRFKYQSFDLPRNPWGRIPTVRMNELQPISDVPGYTHAGYVWMADASVPGLGNYVVLACRKL
jgi:hypothetical protein